MKSRRTKRRTFRTTRRRRQRVDRCFLVVSLLFLSWLWYWNYSVARNNNEDHQSSTKIRGESNENYCYSFGCPVIPPEMDHVNNTMLISRYGNATMATMTRKSNRDNPPVNQDAAVVLVPFISKQTTLANDFFIGIFDGHGSQGHDVANYAATAVPERLAEKLNAYPVDSIPNNEIVQLLKETLVEVDAEAPPSAMLGGCTASVTLRRGNTLFVANTGDSKTIVVSTTDKTEEVVYETRKDKPHLTDELERISKLGGKVHIPPKNPMLSRVVVHSEAAHDTIGLAMSRSIGDWEWGAVGVIAEPVVQVLERDTLTNAFVVAASDGLWDARRPQFVAKHFADGFYRNGKPPLETCRFMIEKASPVKEKFYRDDITLIAVKIT